MPSLSIIVPIYGVEQYLNRALDSVLAQSYKDFEVLLVDDGSKDRSGDICDSYCARDGRFCVFHKENGGYSSAVNTGLENAKGEYIAILEPDDWLPENAYRLLMDAALKQDVDIVKGRYISCYPDGKELSLWIIPDLAKKDVLTGQECGLLFLCHPSIWTCVYKREFIERQHIRMKEVNGAAWTDNPWQVMTLFYAKRVCCIDEVVYNYQILDRSKAKLIKDWRIPFDRIDEIHSWLDEQPKVKENFLAYLYWREQDYINICMQKLSLENRNPMRLRIRGLVSRWLKQVLLKYDDVNLQIKMLNYRRFGFYRAYAARSAKVARLWRVIETIQRFFHGK